MGPLLQLQCCFLLSDARSSLARRAVAKVAHPSKNLTKPDIAATLTRAREVRDVNIFQHLRASICGHLWGQYTHYPPTPGGYK
jgi:hypothetical protein